MWTLVAALLLAGAPPGEIDLAKTALAKELGVAPGTLKLRSSRTAEGCPHQGGNKTLAKGREVRLESQGREYAVHVAAGRAVICAPPREERPPELSRLDQLARKDLAARLGIDEATIETGLVRPTVWPDASLGCADPSMAYAQMETKGFLIELKAKGRTYAYHSDLQRVVSCDR